MLAPTRPAVRRLQSLLAAQGPWVNIHFHTFFTLAVSVLKGAGKEVRPSPPPSALSLLLKEVIEAQSPQNEHTRFFLRYESCLERLLFLFSRFTSYRIDPPAHPVGIEMTLFEIYRSFEDEKLARAIRDAEDLIGDAARLLPSGIPEGVPRTVLLYGFYDLNPAQREIVRHLDEQGDLTICAPGGFSEEAEEFFVETRTFYRELAERSGGHGANISRRS